MNSCIHFIAECNDFFIIHLSNLYIQTVVQYSYVICKHYAVCRSILKHKSEEAMKMIVMVSVVELTIAISMCE